MLTYLKIFLYLMHAHICVFPPPPQYSFSKHSGFDRYLVPGPATRQTPQASWNFDACFISIYIL